jgi:peptidylprolyl isomerase
MLKKTSIALPGCAVLAAALMPFSLMAQTKPVTHHRSTAAASTTAPKLPANIPPAHGILHTEYALRYIDITVGSGRVAEPGKIYVVHYTGWLHDGTKFDSSVDRGEPIEFPQGMHRVIPGWDTGFEGMRVGGKRRLFIPWELAYGVNGRGPIPPKADLIFDVQLVDTKDLPGMGMPPMHPGMTPPKPEAPSAPQGAPQGNPAQPATPPQPNAPATPPQASTPPAAQAPSSTPPPAAEPK